MMLSTQRTFAGGAAASMTAGWPIMGVRVDNYSAQYLQVAGQQIFIAPYTIGATFPLAGAGSVAIAPGIPGPSVTQPKPQTGDTYIVTIFSEPVGTSGGASYAAPASISPFNTQDRPNIINQSQQLPINSAAKMIGLKALAANVGTIWIGFQALGADPLTGWPLAPGDTLALAVTPASQIWWTGANLNDALAVILIR